MATSKDKVIETKEVTTIERSTGNGLYRFVTTKTNGTVNSIVADVSKRITVSVPSADGTPIDQDSEVHIGNIYLENGVININNFPVSGEFSAYITDFKAYVDEITA